MKWFISALFMGAIVSHFSPADQSDQHDQLTALSWEAHALQQVNKVEKIRQATIGKIIHIIDRHNAEMPNGVKRGIAAEIYRMSLKYTHLDVDLICATITHESGSWNPEVVSKAGAMGLMQIMPATGEWLAKYEGIAWTSASDVLFNPIHNIRMGSRYLSALIETYDLEGGLAAYNGGTRRVEMWLARNKASGILWPETRDYVPYILKIYSDYKASPL